jgi:hypothetical protein
MTKKPSEIVNYLVEQYSSINEKVPYINHGGCGVFAEKLYNIMRNIGLKPQLVVITNNRIEMDKRIRGEAHNYGSIIHIVVKIHGKYVDSTGVYKSIAAVADYHKYPLKEREVSTLLTTDVLANWNSQRYFWNERFNRKYIKTIEDKLEKVCNMAKKNLVVTK